ncbi:transporter substrate-binding domain-containing protein [Rhizobium sp. S-51]|uniref:Transporter substrate-binding domain-containing protein n=1 Tax=Rhizobium terricola TaxID=2728849 RepID=A0A7Y0AWZ8_9HYPH|nr:transporter substrate-binding domain-containing protein [Rhizobium terricola]NML74976.1 transporter substrate-binding domain-containing protein [Rhizobium terricola]
MIRILVSSLHFRGLRALVVTACAFLACFSGERPSLAGDLPVLFDARERLSRPDLSGLLRLRFLTTTDFPPFNFTDQTGRLSGFHIDLARAICAELGIEAKCQIQALPFADLEKALEADQGDAVLAGIAVSEDLRRRFAFSRPFMMLPARFARSRQAEIKGDNVQGLDGRRVGVVSGTAHEAMLKAYFPAIETAGFEDRNKMLEALKAKTIEAVFADSLQLSFWVSGEASAACCSLLGDAYVSERFLGEGLTIMARHDDTTLVAAFDSALAALSRNGRLQEIYLRYFPYGLY